MQNDTNFVENQENEGFKILDYGIPKCSRRRPTQPSRLVGFKQEMTPKPSNIIIQKNAGFSPKVVLASGGETLDFWNPKF